MYSNDSRDLEDGRQDQIHEASTGTQKELSGSMAASAADSSIPDGERSNDHLNPRKWSWMQKHVTLLVLSATAFVPDYGAASGASTQIPQAQ